MFKVQERVLQEFRVPFVSGTSVVVHQPGGLSMLTRADSLLWALSTTRQVLQAPAPPPSGSNLAAIPVPTGRADTTVTYLFFSDGTGLENSVRLADQYAAHFDNQAAVGSSVTGFVPAQVAQGDYLKARLPLFEAASVVLIVVVVALAFRSLLAPLVVLGVAGVGYVLYFSVLGFLAAALGFEVPSQLEPVLVALLLGVVTDYCVLLFSSFREELDVGDGNGPATRRALKRDGSVVAVAGLTVAGGTLALLAAPFAIFRGLGPALALTVLVGLAISLTLTPAVMAILGWRLFTVLPVRTSRRAPGRSDAAPITGHPGSLVRMVAVLTRRGPALAATLAVVALLALASIPAVQARLDLSFTAGLPDDDSVARGAQLLDDAGLRGLSAPTEVLVEQPGITGSRLELARLQYLLAREPGVVRVLGPADSPLSEGQGVVLARSGNAARYLVVFDSDPLAAEAINLARRLRDRLPTLVQTAGLPDARAAMTGQTLIASEVADLTRTSLEITVVAALLIELVLLCLYLRALVAPVVLLACSMLSVAAALGLTTLLFQDILGEQGLTFYAPFAATVLLIALGWGTDALARFAAESLLARNVQDATGVAERPGVKVHGSLFLPQVIRGAYSSVDVTTRGITNGLLRVERVDSHLTDVRVPFHDVLVRDIGQVGIGRAHENVTVTWVDLNAYLNRTGRPLTLAPADEGTVEATGSVDLLGHRVAASALLALLAVDGGLRLTPTQIDGTVPLSQTSRLLLNQRLTFTVPLDTLPFGLQLTSVNTNPDGVHAVAAGSGIILQP